MTSAAILPIEPRTFEPRDFVPVFRTSSDNWGHLGGAAAHSFAAKPQAQGVGGMFDWFQDALDDIKDEGQKFIDVVIRPIGQAVAPFIQQMFRAIGGVVGEIVGGPLGRSIGEGIGHVFGGAVAALMNNDSSVSSAIKRSLRTACQVMLASLVGGPGAMSTICGKMPGFGTFQQVMSHPVGSRVSRAAISGDVRTLLSDTTFLTQAATMVPGVGPQTADLLRNIDNAVQSGVTVLSTAERAGLAALSNVQGQLQMVDAGAVAHFEGMALEVSEVAKAIRDSRPAGTQGVGAEPDWEAMAIAAIDAAVTDSQAAVQRLQAALLGEIPQEDGKKAAAHALDYIAGTTTIDLPPRFAVEHVPTPRTPTTNAAHADRIDATPPSLGGLERLWPGAAIPGADVTALSGYLSGYFKVAGYAGTFQDPRHFPTATEEAAYNPETLVAFQPQGGQAGPTRLAYALHLVRVENRALGFDLEAVDADGRPTGIRLKSALCVVRVLPDAGPRIRPDSAEPFRFRVTAAALGNYANVPMPIEITEADKFIHPQTGRTATAAQIAADPELAQADDIHCTPLTTSDGRSGEGQYATWRRRYSNTKPPNGKWIAFVLSKGGAVVALDGRWISRGEYQHIQAQAANHAAAERQYNQQRNALFDQLVAARVAAGATTQFGRIDPDMDVWVFAGGTVTGPHKALQVAQDIAESRLADGVTVLAGAPVSGRINNAITFEDGQPALVVTSRTDLLQRVQAYNPAETLLTKADYDAIDAEIIRILGPRPGFTPLTYGTADEQALVRDNPDADVLVVNASPAGGSSGVGGLALAAGALLALGALSGKRAKKKS